MRITLLGAILATTVSLIAGACKTAGPPSMIGNDRVVNMNLECLADGGVSFSLSPWRVPAPRGGSIIWVLGRAPQGNRTVIKPANAARWPFQEGEFTTEPGNPNAPGRHKEGVAPGIYKYTVTTICNRAGGVKDTVIIDPDMMIPTLW